MLYMTREERLLSLEKMVNTRDLGGYETQNGTYSRSHKYIRASSPAQATQKDLDDLKDYGVKAVIDLRSDFEKEHQLNPFANDKDIDYYEVNLLIHQKQVLFQKKLKNIKILEVFIFTL